MSPHTPIHLQLTKHFPHTHILSERWVQEAEWELTAPAVVDTDEFNGEIGPADLSFAKVTPRKKSKEGGKGE